MSPMAGVVASGRRPKLLDGRLTDFDSSTASASTYTFPGLEIGTPSATRRVAVAVHGRDTVVIPTSVTVGGVALTMDEVETSTHIVSIWSGVIPTGSTADVVVTLSAANTFCAVGVWAMDKGIKITSARIDGVLGVIDLSGLATFPGDFVIGATSYVTTAPAATAGWAAASEQYDVMVDGRHRQAAGAHLYAAGATVDMSVTIGSADTYGGVGCAVVYRASPTHSDSFARADSTTGLGISSSGHAWEATAGTWGISTGRARNITADAVTVLNVGYTDMAVQITGNVASGSFGPQLVARCAGANDLYWLEPASTNGSLALKRRQGGVITTLATSATGVFTYAVDTVFKLQALEVAGVTQLKGFVGGVEVVSFNDSNVGRPNGTRAGLRGGNGGTASRADDFAVDRIGVA